MPLYTYQQCDTQRQIYELLFGLSAIHYQHLLQRTLCYLVPRTFGANKR